MGEPATIQSLGADELEVVVRKTLDEAGARGVDQAEVAVSHDMGLSATARLGDVEHLEYTNDRGIGSALTMTRSFGLVAGRTGQCALQLTPPLLDGPGVADRDANQPRRDPGAPLFLLGHLA